ncbi:MAG TPA: 16S rRNA (adenine(1518)-N(6)/adenine(1519)-N(6))-dimethyltransferase RsmA [Thermoanaerobaculia bacterium]|nr:16S rRNA (adenine(1518)-N(6)/adenine(1519)-N(6))-dimethyltransferase RsmA [Thermoanaerobaculia bacterium]
MPSPHERKASRRSGPPTRRKWGQNFLKSSDTAERIVAAARVGPGEHVLEIGPGDGALTRPLAERAACVAAVEIDPIRARALAEELADRPNVRVLEGDVLARPFRDWLDAASCPAPAVLVANLPYNVATPILTAAIESPETIRRSVATVQREVARRFVARPGEDGYGYLSVRVAAHATGRVLFDLPPGAFRPRPKVWSSVLELEPRADAPDPGLVRRALCLASLGFNARRKTLGNALASAGPRSDWEERLAGLGRGPRTRAEELSLDDFLFLARDWRPRA